MTDRMDLLQSFLSGSAWAGWDIQPLAGDASSRRYFRLTNAMQSVILMDADPATGQETAVFQQIGDWLFGQNLCAPKILLQDHAHGFLVLDDLGAVDFAMHLMRNPAESDLLYTAATDILIQLDSTQPPPNLQQMSPDVGGDMLSVTAEWYGNSKNCQIVDVMKDHLARLCPDAGTIALRDFHAENLIWRPDLTGMDRVGLLDYQDALVAPRGYDLVSLLRDVRRQVAPDLAQRMTAYFIAKTGATPDALACLAVQRNLRILGVFARLALRDKKPRYIKMIPHIWRMIAEDLRNPALSDLQYCVAQTLPAPENSAIKDLL